MSYPDDQRLDLEEVGLDDDRLDEYRDFVERGLGEGPYHQIGGFPYPLQHDNMEEQCHLASQGVDLSQPGGYTSLKAQRLRADSHDWRLLLQFDTDPDIGAVWGPGDTLYFWIRAEDAIKGHFDDTWLIHQFT
jgi:uncharacterized protein YwqG